MKTRLILFLAFTCSFAITAYSQNTVYYRSLSSEIRQARELYEKNDFISAGELFASIAEKSEPASAIQSQALFYQALCALKTKSGNGEQFITQYIKSNPESPYINQAWFELGNVRFEREQYPQMLEAFGKVKSSGLSHEDQIRMIYQKGYALFRQEEYAQAEAEFKKIKDSRTRMAAPAKYYWAHIQYLNERYDEALRAFDELKGNAAFASLVPYYISHIYYKQERYKEVIELTEPLIRTADEQQKPSLSKILANSYFQLDRFSEAIPHFESYFSKTQSAQRNENYMLGYCYYVTGRYQDAILPLENATKGNDLLAQNAFYHLADCYIKAGDKNKARIAFDAASNMDYDPNIKEDALFNFAKITYELSYSPFNETINAFDRYIALYPNSERNAAAYDYLVKVYMSTNNFKDAVASIERIQVKSTAIKKAWQRVTFYHGLELFNNMDYSAAAENFSKSLENGTYDSRLQAGATFWKAESMYHLGNYRLAVSGFNQFLNLPAARSLTEFNLANYNLGYAYFQLKEYDQAIASFEKYMTGSQNQSADKLGDTYNRIGDCYFIKRDYRNAARYYDQAYSKNTYDPDYALYQKALCQGLLQEQEQKISSLRTLLQTFTESDLSDDACYELGRTYERINQPQAAINSYNELLQKYPESNYQSKALLQLGLVYYNQSDFNRSLSYYKRVAEQFPNSAEARSAMLGIKNNYMEMDNVDAYFAYARQIGAGDQVSASEQDSLTYNAAEKQVMNNDSNARASLERYLSQFPDGNFKINARYYLAEKKYAAGEYSSALSDYESILAGSDHIFTEPALIRAAELQYNGGAYQKALSYFERLEKTSNTKWNLLKARSGKMRCYFELQNYQACIEAANSLLTTENIPEVVRREAGFKLAKSMYLTNKRDQALLQFRELAKDIKSAEGAESKYLMAEILVAQNKLSEAESEIMDFISKNTPYQFWLAKSFILLADIYLLQNDDFQAKHTLQSIVENYPHSDDGIIEAAKERLNRLQQKENQQQQKKEAPIQIDINQQ